MDILNFISWIRGKRIVTSVNPTKTLVPVGLKDDRRDDEYLAGAISIADLGAQFGGTVVWGNIFGDIEDQSDLDAALNAKQDVLTLTTTGTGAATLVGSTLNIPVSSGGGGLDIETITVDMAADTLLISIYGPNDIEYVFAGWNTFDNAKSSIISLSDGSYLVGPVVSNGGSVPV
jgi:hypothetical protein